MADDELELEDVDYDGWELEEDDQPDTGAGDQTDAGQSEQPQEAPPTQTAHKEPAPAPAPTPIKPLVPPKGGSAPSAQPTPSQATTRSAAVAAPSTSARPQETSTAAAQASQRQSTTDAAVAQKAAGHKGGAAPAGGARRPIPVPAHAQVKQGQHEGGGRGRAQGSQDGQRQGRGGPQQGRLPERPGRIMWNQPPDGGHAPMGQAGPMPHLMAARMQLQGQQQLRGNFQHQQHMINPQQQGSQGMMVQHHHPQLVMQQQQQQHRQQQQQQQQQMKGPGSASALPLPPNFHVMQALALGPGRDKQGKGTQSRGPSDSKAGSQQWNSADAFSAPELAGPSLGLEFDDDVTFSVPEQGSSAPPLPALTGRTGAPAASLSLAHGMDSRSAPSAAGKATNPVANPPVSRGLIGLNSSNGHVPSTSGALQGLPATLAAKPKRLADMPPLRNDPNPYQRMQAAQASQSADNAAAMREKEERLQAMLEQQKKQLAVAALTAQIKAAEDKVKKLQEQEKAKAAAEKAEAEKKAKEEAERAEAARAAAEQAALEAKQASKRARGDQHRSLPPSGAQARAKRAKPQAPSGRGGSEGALLDEWGASGGSKAWDQDPSEGREQGGDLRALLDKRRSSRASDEDGRGGKGRRPKHSGQHRTHDNFGCLHDPESSSQR
ncbi:hypothetical protein WJX73_001764 [Symbiochloris irregularis]|uniref:Uncharacterized protein n=1 Tax=Symbiochloris irregularis TaxID=706552 RepID=A0AAW1NQJ0_9CHLO